MKGFLLVVAVCVASVSAAIPQQQPQGRWIEGIVEDRVEELRQGIRAAGLDPFEFSQSIAYKLPVTDFFDVEAGIEEFILEGASNIVINNIDFSIFSARVRYDVSLPSLSAKIGTAGGRMKLGNRQAVADVSGDVEAVDARVTGEVRLYLGIITGVSVTSLTVEFTVAEIKSNLAVQFFDRDLSEFTNNAIGNAIPAFLEENRADINTILSHFAFQIVDRTMNGDEE